MRLLKEPDHTYHGFKDVLTSTRLRVFMHCPAEYKQLVDSGWPGKDSPEMRIGRAVHTMALEGDEAYSQNWYVCDGPVNPSTGKPYGMDTKKYAEWLEETAVKFPNKQIIQTAEHHRVYDIVQSVRHNGTFKSYCTWGQAEGVIRGEIEGIKAQCRIDYCRFSADERGDTNVLVDLKTTADLDRFEYAIADYKYVYQSAFYSELFLQLMNGEDHESYIVAVETKPPYRCGAWFIPPPILDDAREKVKGYIKELKSCLKTNKWPTRYETLREVSRY